MIFSSIEFLYIFLPIALFTFYRIGDLLGRRIILILLSITFYSFWSVPYLVLMLALISSNYLIARMILSTHEAVRRKFWFGLGILISLFALGYYKYSYFIVTDVLKMDGASFEDIVLPLAISFYTFQQIAFLTHVYDRSVQRFDVLTYFSYVLFFPQLIAGPIVDYSDVSADLNKPIKFFKSDFCKGMLLFSIGFFKKTVFADYFALGADEFYSSVGERTFTTSDSWHGTLSYSLQLYFDFSGYCDMAIGLGLMFGMRLPINFDSPYQASSIQDFWRTWHITLGRFLNRHIYRPLGGNRKGFAVELTAGVVTFVLGGIWHGAGFTFILWGLLHSGYLVVNKVYNRYIGISLGYVGVMVTFLAVHFAWVPFRAERISDVYDVYEKMLMPVSIEQLIAGKGFVEIVAGLLIVFFMPNSLRIAGYKTGSGALINAEKKWVILLAGFALSICVLKLIAVPHTAFIYYDF
jgi:alginate O-acetyltransferase complex protein AlgI